MGAEARKILRTALQLSTRERSQMAASLIDSLDKNADARLEAKFAREIARRIQEVDDGAVKLIPWEKVRRQILSNE